MIDATTMAESFGRIVQTLCLCALPILLGTCGIVWMHEHDIYILRKFKGMFKSVQGILAAIAIAALVVYGGSKPQTNNLQRIIQPQARQIQQISQNQIDAGFALARIGTNEAHDFSAPAGATVCDRWRLRGANVLHAAKRKVMI